MQPIALPLFLLAAALPAQMAGSYLIDPTGGGDFASFAEASNELFVHGVAGPVTIDVVPGTYIESVLVLPMVGTSTSKPVMFRSQQGPGTVFLQGNGGDIFAMQGWSFAPIRSLVFDGLDFIGAPGHAISGTTYVADIEIRNCTFQSGHQSSALGEDRHAEIVGENSDRDGGWHWHQKPTQH